MNGFRSAAGMLEVELTSAELESAVSAILDRGIPMWDFHSEGELSCRFCIQRKDFPALSVLCKKRGGRLRIRKKRGLFWSGKRLLQRPILLLGMLILFGMTLYLPTRVLFLRVEGNRSIPERKILDAAESCGIGFGASRRAVRSEKMKNALLEAVPELKWAGVNTYGCVAVISVREGAESDVAKEKPLVTSILAARDGYILSGTVTQGNALFQVGQTVKQGQLLISGYTDCGICIRATRAEGDILALTNREFVAVTPGECLYLGEAKEIKRKYSLLFRKKRINLWKDSGISPTTCGRMYEEYYITLPGGFRLPIALCVETYTYCDKVPGEISQEEAETALKAFSEQYTKQQMIAGRIQERKECLTFSDGLYRLEGAYVCTEMIGREQPEQIGEIHGKSG